MLRNKEPAGWGWIVILIVLSAAGSALAEEARAPDAGAEAPPSEPRTESIHHQLKQGDRLVHLSRRYGVSVDAILEANGLQNARGLKIGQQISIPPQGTVAKVQRSKVTLPTNYRVHKGDVLGSVARRFGVSIDDILIANDLASPRSIRSGQKLLIPRPGEAIKARKAAEREARRAGRGSKTKRGRKASKSEPRWMRRARKLAKKLGLGTRRVALKILRGDVDRRWVRAAGKGRAPSSLRLPVVGGWFGRGWGAGPGGYHLAVDFPGRLGTRVNAAAPGIVAYANNELAGFGKVVIIVHPGGLATLYAHNREFKTLAGERVKRGTRIALLGSTGISRGPHVHFELIHNGELCDPLPLFRPQARNKAGRPVINKRQLRNWPRRGGPPKGVRCSKRRRHPAYVGKPYGWRPADWATRHRKKTGGAARATQDAGAPHPDPELDAPAPAPTPVEGVD